MNLMRQRDDLRDMCKAGVISQAQLELALAAPAFQWWPSPKELSDLEWEFLFDHLIERTDVPGHEGKIAYWPRVTPYEVFRVVRMDEPVYDLWLIGPDKLTCIRSDSGYDDKRVDRVWSCHYTRKGEGFYKMWMWVNGIKAEEDGEGKRRAGRVVCNNDKETMEAFATHPMKSLACFLFEIYATSSTVIKVSPNQPGRSVQWRQAREHYLVLHRRQARELQATQRPHTDEDLIRSAHWRMAHIRRLTSGRFVNKRGMTVKVSQAWIGPKEWLGKDGKVYTVVGMKPPDLPR